ncbi:50S ribosomal protein L29 [bacterium]|nr:50S ribosomal protein L29 [bacterium]
MTKPKDLREKSSEQLEFSISEAREQLFRLRFQSATEKLDRPSELRQLRREVARIKTILRQRQDAPAAQ